MSPGLLNLSDADLKGFEPLEPGRYKAVIHEITIDHTKNDGATPKGTPMIKVQFRINDDSVTPPIKNRAVWTQYVVPPKGHDVGKAQKMKGMIARFFIALGDTEEQVRSKDFDPDFEDYKGRECVVTLGKEQKKDREGNVIDGEFNNPVKGVKPAGSDTGSAGGGLL